MKIGLPVALVMCSALRWRGSAEANAVPLFGVERQITHEPYGHVLTNANVWSPDGKWLVYDIRNSDDFNGTRIEEVNVETLKVRVLYRSRDGAACGIVSFNPTVPEVAFVVGPENPTADWRYGFTHRHGLLMELQSERETVRNLDAMNYAAPFVDGALRGGSHVHIFSPDGTWVSFTYEDDVLAQLGEGPGHELNQRNVGVAVPAGPVHVSGNFPRNHDGAYFSVLVTRTVSHPAPGSDEIARACEEGWIGTHGYIRNDGSRQVRALAFQGTVIDAGGRPRVEVFVADLPTDMTRPGAYPLGGTATTRPAPPQGVTQRRLTDTGNRPFPGVVSLPRHWLRTAPDGSSIAFLMKDDAGIVQLFTVSPNGGAVTQVTHNRWNIASTISWSPDGRRIAYVMDNSVWVTEVSTGASARVSPRTGNDTAPSPLACVYSPDGSRIAYMRSLGSGAQRFSQLFVVSCPR